MFLTEGAERRKALWRRERPEGKVGKAGNKESIYR
jgi:hypothetical protein